VKFFPIFLRVTTIFVIDQLGMLSRVARVKFFPQLLSLIFCAKCEAAVRPKEGEKPTSGGQQQTLQWKAPSILQMWSPGFYFAMQRHASKDCSIGPLAIFTCEILSTIVIIDAV